MVIGLFPWLVLLGPPSRRFALPRYHVILRGEDPEMKCSTLVDLTRYTNVTLVVTRTSVPKCSHSLACVTISSDSRFVMGVSSAHLSTSCAFSARYSLKIPHRRRIHCPSANEHCDSSLRNSQLLKGQEDISLHRQIHTHLRRLVGCRSKVLIHLNCNRAPQSLYT